jgi:hypothetical protein
VVRQQDRSLVAMVIGMIVLGAVAFAALFGFVLLCDRV